MKKVYLENSGRYINDLLRFDCFSKNSNLLSNSFVPLAIGTVFLFSIGLFGFYRFNIPIILKSIIEYHLPCQSIT